MGRRKRSENLRALALCALLAVPSAAIGQQMPPMPVRSTEVRTHAVRPLVKLPGSVRSRTSSVVASEVAGLVVELAARDGDRVRRGAPIARLRPQTLELRRDAARSGLKEAVARLELATRNLARSRELFDSGVVSRSQLDDAVSEADAWQGRVDQLEADIARLEDDLERSVIRAPFSGVVVAEHIQVGQWMDVGGPVVDLVDLAELEVVVDVPEREFARLVVGGPAVVTFGALPEVEIEGRIGAIIPRADAQARSFPVKVRIANAEERIGIGMLAQVAFPAGEAREALVVPKDAVVRQGSDTLVWLVDDQGAVRPVPVSVGAAVGDWVEVEGELSSGEHAVTRGNERLRPDLEVVATPLEYELP
jgi:membrane fusion protein (multidrug efflux system)